MKYAWIENDKIRDICQGGNPSDYYHPDVAALYTTEVPDDAQNDDGWVNNELVKPTTIEPVVFAKTWISADVRDSLTLVERVKWDNDKSDEIKTAKIELSSPSFRAKTKEVLDMLVASGDISQSSADIILSKGNDGDAIPVTVT